MRANFFGVHRDLINEWKNKPKWILAWNFILCFTPYEDNELKGEVRGQVNLTNIKPKVGMTDKEWRLFLDHLEDQKMLCDFTVKRHGRGGGSTQTAMVHGDYLPLLPNSLQQDTSEKQGQSKGQSNGVLKDGLNTVQDDVSSDEGQSKGQSNGVLKDGHIKEIYSLSVFTSSLPPTESKKVSEELPKSEPQQDSPTQPQALKFFKRFLGNGADWLASKLSLEDIYETWGEQALKDLWRECSNLNRNKPGDKPIYRLEDALKGAMETQTKPLNAKPVMAAAQSISKRDLEAEMQRGKLVAGDYMPPSYLEGNKVVTSLEVYNQLLREERLS